MATHYWDANCDTSLTMPQAATPDPPLHLRPAMTRPLYLWHIRAIALILSALMAITGCSTQDMSDSTPAVDNIPVVTAMPEPPDAPMIAQCRRERDAELVNELMNQPPEAITTTEEGWFTVPVDGTPHITHIPIDESLYNDILNRVNQRPRATFVEKADRWSLIRDEADRQLLLAEGIRPLAIVALDRKNDDTWRIDAARWVDCPVTVEGWQVPALWELDRQIHPEDTAITVRATVMECGGMEHPLPEEIHPAVATSQQVIVITILIEPHTERQECLPQPPFLLTIDLGEPIGNRALLDGANYAPKIHDRLTPPGSGFDD